MSPSKWQRWQTFPVMQPYRLMGLSRRIGRRRHLPGPVPAAAHRGTHGERLTTAQGVMKQGGFTAALLIRTQIGRCIERQRTFAEHQAPGTEVRARADRTLELLDAAFASIEATLTAQQAQLRNLDRTVEPAARRRRIPPVTKTPRPARRTLRP